MAYRTVTIFSKRYHFTPPKKFSESDFKYFKQLLESNPKAKLNEGLKENPIIKGLKTTGSATLGIISFMFNPYQGVEDIKTELSHKKFKKEEGEFYEIIKEITLKSSSYVEFENLLTRVFSHYNNS
jgi:hypothetical protein